MNPDWGPRLGEQPLDVLKHVLELDLEGEALEFGVASGTTLNLIQAVMPATGFDSFQGLPEKWRPGFGKGRFACEPPQTDATLVVGQFEDTLPSWRPGGRIGLVHIDCDLYSSTAVVLGWIGTYLSPGTVIVFDEYHSYPGWQAGEARAWAEHVERAGIQWEPIGHGPEQLAVRLLASSSPGGTKETRTG